MIIKGIQPLPEGEIQAFEGKFPKLGKWLRLLGGGFPKVQTFQSTLDPTSIGANSESLQTFTVEGLLTNDVVIVNKPTNTANIGIDQVFVSAKDKLAIKFRNYSGGAIDLGSEVYRIVAIRL